jgi:hypothetical protein
MANTPTKQKIEIPPYITVLINAAVIMLFLLSGKVNCAYRTQ